MRRRSRKTRTHMSTMAELNVTPLLDLAFVLLIIFMITAPLLANRVDLILPTSKATRDAVPQSQTFMVDMNNEGVLEVEGAVISNEALATRLNGAKEKDPAVGVIIRADHTLTIAQLMPILDVLKSQDIVDVGFVAKSEPN